MYRLLTFFISLFFLQFVHGQNIGDFISVSPSAQTQLLVIPSSHRYQLLARSGDSIDVGGVLKSNLDYTAYVPIDGSSRNGHLSLNHEISGAGGVTIMDIHFDSVYMKWDITYAEAVDMTPVVKCSRNCAGGLTPWGTVISAEESLDPGDINGDGYEDVGWLTEVNPVTRTVVNKWWAVGRASHENAAINSSGTILYTGADESTRGFVYKFIPNEANNFSDGTLYVLKKTTDSTGIWLVLANSTPAERNTTAATALALGATNYSGMEEIEIGPDGLIYFAVKSNGNIYRFRDLGISGVDQFETFVASTTFPITSDNGNFDEPWGTGQDNLAFDGDGNLWVLQDGTRNCIWMVKPNHTAANPQVQLFGKTPIGCEPTGITFSSDFKFLFMSFQHPSTSNNEQQTDALGNSYAWNKHTTIVIARETDLGPQPCLLDPNPTITEEMISCDDCIYHYSIPTQPPGTIISWTVTGGEIISGQGDNSILVQWQEGSSGSVSVTTNL